MKPIYMDYNATTPVIPEVVDAMLPCFSETFGNPSSSHALGRAARVKLDEARDQVAALVGAHPGELVFTSGGTESDNLAILGTAEALREKGNHIITSSVEHPAVLNPCRELERRGFRVNYLPVDNYGRVDSEQLKERLTDQTLLVSIQYANSEIGTLQPIQHIGEILRERGILFHVDAVQGVGKVPVDVRSLPVDLLSLSSHKMYGPKGVGALYVRRGVPALIALISGGGQEKKRRGGTENIPGIVGFGRAAQWLADSLETHQMSVDAMRINLKSGLENTVPGVEFYGHPTECLPNTICLGFEGVDGQSLMIRLDINGVAISTGTACSSGSLEPSVTLTALGLSDEKAGQAIRLSLGRLTTPDEIDRVLVILKQSVADIRQKHSVGS